MTATERMLLGAVRTVQSSYATNGTFTMSNASGTLGTFVGVVGMPVLTITPESGGEFEERTLTIVAEKEQFEDHVPVVTPAIGDSVTLSGTRYIIESIPGRDSDAVAYTFNCVSPMKGGSR